MSSEAMLHARSILLLSIIGITSFAGVNIVRIQKGRLNNTRDSEGYTSSNIIQALITVNQSIMFSI